MPKLMTLLNSQLKEILRVNDLDTQGVKAEMVARLAKHFGTDEIDATTLNYLFPQANSSFADEINAMKDLMKALVAKVEELSKKPVPSTNALPSEEGEKETNHEGNGTDGVEITEHDDDNISIRSSNENSQSQRVNTQNRYSVKEIAETIPEYDPTRESSLSAEQFVQHVESARKAYKWEDKCLLLAVYSRLKGVARLWFDCRESIFWNWCDFKTELLNEFGSSFDEAEINFKMTNATRRSDEKVLDYCFRIHALGKRFNLSESAIIRYAREGMKHRDLQNAMAALKFVSMKQFRETITEYFSNMPSSSRPSYAGTKSNNSDKQFDKQLDKRNTRTTNYGYSPDIYCYNCNEKGHISKNCSKPQKRERCTNCQRTSHKTEECPSRQQNITIRKPNINSIADSDETYNDVIREIEVNGKPTTVFMDSGSPASLIRKTYALVFGELLQQCSKKLSGFAGGSYILTQKMPTIIVIDGNRFEADLLVVEDEDIPEDVLIGRDLICKKGNRLIIENGKCRVENTNSLQVATIEQQPQDPDLQEILNENRHCYAEKLSELGKCSVEKMQIQLKTNEPVNMKPYRIAFAKREIVANIIEELLDCQIIRTSQSHYASPVVLVGKKNGEHRSCEPAGYIYKLSDQQSDWVVALQHRDDRVIHIVNVLTGKIKSSDEKEINRDYKLLNGRLYYKNGEELLFYVPKAARLNLIKHYHDDMGHFALEKTLQRLMKWFWFPKMRKLVKEYIKACLNCCYNKSQRAKPEGELHFSEQIPIPFRMLHVDHLGPFVRSRQGNTHLLVITDAFSKFCIIKAVRNTKTGPVIKIINEIVSYFGLPETLISDRGTAFTSKLFEKFCELNQIRHIKTAVRTPRANGQVDRSNATILDSLKTSNTDPKRWDENLEQLQWAMNSQFNATTRFTPNELIFNYNINDVVRNHLVSAVTSEYPVRPSLAAQEKRESALNNIAAERQKWKLRFDKAHAKPTEYVEGDLVVIKNEPAATGESRKLEPRYRGPYVIARVLGRGRYVIKDVPGLQLRSRPFNSVYVSDQLKPWCHGYPELVYNHSNDLSDDGDASSAAVEFSPEIDELPVGTPDGQEEPSCHNQS